MESIVKDGVIMQNTAFGVQGLIMKEDKALLLFKSNGDLDLSGGRTEDGESLTEGLYREIFEETGLEVKIVDPFIQWSFIRDPELLVTGMTYYC